MKYIWCAINTSLILLVFLYAFVSKDIMSKTYDKCQELEVIVNEQKALNDKVVETFGKKDTIVIYINKNVK